MMSSTTWMISIDERWVGIRSAPAVFELHRSCVSGTVVSSETNPPWCHSSQTLCGHVMELKSHLDQTGTMDNSWNYILISEKQILLMDVPQKVPFPLWAQQTSGVVLKHTRRVQQLNIRSKRNDPTNAGLLFVSQVKVDSVKNPPAEKFRCVRLPFKTVTKGLWWQLGDTRGESSLPDLSNVSATPHWRFKEKRSAFPLPSHLSAWYIASLCFHKSVTTEPSNATEGTGSMTKHLNKRQMEQ